MNELANEQNDALAREPEATVSALQNVEQQLNLLLEELQSLNLSTEGMSEETLDSRAERWDSALEGFRVKATTIRRILDRFHDSDLPTRRYLRHHLDEEFSQLKKAYDTLREQFTAKDEGGSPWNG